MLILMQPFVRIMNNNDGKLFPARKASVITNLCRDVASWGPVVPGPPFEIGALPFHVWPTGCCTHPILHLKNVPPFWFLAPPSGFWPPLLLHPGDGPELTHIILGASAHLKDESSNFRVFSRNID